jgi:hypothetical protein
MSSFGEGTERSAGLLVYTYDDPDYGTSEVAEILFREGGRISNMRYQADPSTFPLYLPIFNEMFFWYEFAPSSPALAPDPVFNPENACFLGEDVTVLSSLSPDTTLSPQAAGVISENLNTHFTFQ